MSGKYSPGMLDAYQKLLDRAKQSATVALKTYSKRVIQKTAEATDYLIGNETANKITKISKKLETATNENDKGIPKERYMSPEKRQENIHDLRLK